MNRRDFIKQAGLGALALGAAGSRTAGAAPAARRPNFLVIVADDMGWSDPACYGGEIETPNLDRLAANGLKYTSLYSTARCWPSRSCILTGYYAAQIRRDVPTGGGGGKRPAWAPLLPEYLRPAGYRSYHSGKWHVDGKVLDGGFDRSYCLNDHNRNFNPQNHTLDDQPLPPVKLEDGYYTSTAFAQYAIDFLKQHQKEHPGEPFFQYLAFTVPHFPLHAPQEDVARYRGKFREGWDVLRERRWRRMRDMGLVDCGLSPRDPDARPWSDLTAEERDMWDARMAVHAAMVDRMDREIGRVLDQVRAMGALDDTVVLFVSDNGASAESLVRGDGNDPTAPPGSSRTFQCLETGWSNVSNAPFRRHKIWVHEGGISSPLIVHWPAGLRARGELRHTPGHFIDVVPTLTELAGVKLPDTWKGQARPAIAGRSLVPSFARDVTIERDCLWWYHSGNRAVRAGDLKLVSEGARGPWELYDISKDRCESNNLATKQPGKVGELAALWERKEQEFVRDAGGVRTAK